MPHPFFGAISYPWARQDAQTLHRTLTEVIPDPADITLLYQQCGGAVPLTTPANAQRMWQEALAYLTRAGVLRDLITKLLQDEDLKASWPIFSAIENAVDIVHAVEATDDAAIVVDREQLRTNLDRMRLRNATEHVLLIRGEPDSGKSWSRRLVELAASERGAGSIYISKELTPTLELVLHHLFTCMVGDADGDALMEPVPDTADDAWLKKTCGRLLSAAKKSSKPQWWIIVDDLGMEDGAPRMDPKTKLFFDQLALFMTSDEYRERFYLILIDYPEGKLPSMWRRNIDILQDRTKREDIDVEHVDAYLSKWTEKHGIKTTKPLRSLAEEVIANAENAANAEPDEYGEIPSKLELIHDQILEIKTSLKGSVQ